MRSMSVSRMKEWIAECLLRLHAHCAPVRRVGTTNRLADEDKLELNADDCVLIVAPHYDDEVVGCFHFLTRFANDCTMQVAFVSEDLDDREYAMARLRESISVLAPAGVVDLHHWQLGDGDVGASEELLAEKLRECNELFDYILTPAPNDRTPDHMVIARVASEVCSPQKLIWYRSTWWTFSLEEADFVVSGSGSAKRRALRRFSTQSALSLSNAVSFSRWEALRSGMRVESVEAFQFGSSRRLSPRPMNILSLKSLLRLGSWN